MSTPREWRFSLIFCSRSFSFCFYVRYYTLYLIYFVFGVKWNRSSFPHVYSVVMLRRLLKSLSYLWWILLASFIGIYYFSLFFKLLDFDQNITKNDFFFFICWFFLAVLSVMNFYCILFINLLEMLNENSLDIFVANKSSRILLSYTAWRTISPEASSVTFKSSTDLQGFGFSQWSWRQCAETLDVHRLLNTSQARSIH